MFMLLPRGPLAWVLSFVAINALFILLGFVAEGLVDVNTCNDEGTVCGIFGEQPVGLADASIGANPISEASSLIGNIKSVVITGDFAIFQYRDESIVVYMIWFFFQLARVLTFSGLVLTTVWSLLSGRGR